MLYKYPRTYHFSFSPGATSDDKILSSDDCFLNKEVIVTEKMDGENWTLYNNYCHARSLNSRGQEYRDWIKAFHASKKQHIPNNTRICGEYLFAKHSIYYENLPSYFLLFSIWEENKCLSWEETKIYAELLNIEMVPVLYEGIYDKEKILATYKNNMEGFVVRIIDSFMLKDFSTSVAKFVRKNHVTTSQHWMYQEITKNKLR